MAKEAQLKKQKKVLAQSGGDDDEARMIIAAGHIACRRLDAAREALHNLQQPEGYMMSQSYSPLFVNGLILGMAR